MDPVPLFTNYTGHSFKLQQQDEQALTDSEENHTHANWRRISVPFLELSLFLTSMGRGHGTAAGITERVQTH